MGLKEILDMDYPGKENLRIRVAMESAANSLLRIKDSDGFINPGYLEKNYRKVVNRMYNLPGGWARLVSLIGLDPIEEAVRKHRYIKPDDQVAEH